MRRAALALTLLAGVAAAQDRDAERPVRDVTLQDVVDLGLSYNLGIESARLSALIARLGVREANAAWDATINGSIGGSETLTPSRSALAGANVVDVDNFNYSLGVTQPFRLGPSLGATWRSDRNFTNSTFSTINPSYDSSLELSLTVPLLRGRGRYANEAELRAARHSLDASREQLRREVSDVVERVAAAFWNVVYLQSRVGVLEQSVAVAREIEGNERRKLEPDIGRSTELDVQKAAAETKRREAAVIRGRQEALDAADDLRALVLPFSGGPKDEVLLRAVATPRETTPIPELDPALGAALDRRPELRSADADLKRLAAAVATARNVLRPQLDLVGTVTWRGTAGTFNRASGDVIEGETPSGGAQLNLTWPLGRRAARAAVRRAELELARARIDRREQVSAIIIEVRKAHRALVTAVREIDATRQEVGAARASLDGERKRLERGSATVIEVSQLEENLRDALLRLLQAQTDLEKAHVTLRKAAGMILDDYGVRLGRDYAASRRR